MQDIVKKEESGLMVNKVNEVFQGEVLSTIKRTVFPDSTSEELILFAHKCKTVGVHPLDGLIHPIVYTGKDNSRKLSFIASIDLLRSRCEKPDYNGMDEPEWIGETTYDTPQDKAKYEGKTYTAPDTCIVKVWRKGIDRPFVGIARWKEYYPGDHKGAMWRSKPYLMLAKCAEALSRRLAYPLELNELYSKEEFENTVLATTYYPENNSNSKPNVTPDMVKVEESPYEPSGRMPTPEQVKSLQLINYTQAKNLVSLCNKCQVEVNAVCRAAKIENVYWVTNNSKSSVNYGMLYNTIQKRPNAFSKYTDAAIAAKEAMLHANNDSHVQVPSATDQAGNSVDVKDDMPKEEFEKLAKSIAEWQEIDLASVLKECCGVDMLEDVLPSSYSKVIDKLNEILITDNDSENE